MTPSNVTRNWNISGRHWQSLVAGWKQEVRPELISHRRALTIYLMSASCPPLPLEVPSLLLCPVQLSSRDQINVRRVIGT